MKEEYTRLDGLLRDVPKGRIQVSHVHLDQESHPPHPDRMRMGTDGRGRIESIELFPGIELSLHQYMADRVVLRHASVPDVLEIHHCRQGRCGLKLRQDTFLFLGAGDLFIQTLENAVDSEMSFPIGYYEGINIQINLQLLDQRPPEILREAGLNSREILGRICPEGKPVSLPSEHDIEHIFKDLYDKPEHLRLPYYRIKVLELLLYLSQRNAPAESDLSGYQTSQTVLIRRIHEQLTGNLQERPTIEELAKAYHINTTTLKQVFRGVYGQPVATYMKEYRMRKAMQLLASGSCSVAEAATLVGYENQSKFTAAFKQFTGTVPSKYGKG